jgi:hypothetical protein
MSKSEIIDAINESLRNSEHREAMRKMAEDEPLSDESRIRDQQDDDCVTLDGDPIGIGATDTPLPDAYRALREHIAAVKPVPDAIHGRRAQIVSFAYGNLSIEHPDITRESVWAALDELTRCTDECDPDE